MSKVLSETARGETRLLNFGRDRNGVLSQTEGGFLCLTYLLSSPEMSGPLLCASSLPLPAPPPGVSAFPACVVLLLCAPQTVDKASIQRLTESFVTKLQTDFPSTVSTIYRLQLHTCFMHISALNISCVLQVSSDSLTVKLSTCVTQDQ